MERNFSGRVVKSILEIRSSFLGMGQSSLHKILLSSLLLALLHSWSVLLVFELLVFRAKGNVKEAALFG